MQIDKEKELYRTIILNILKNDIYMKCLAHMGNEELEQLPEDIILEVVKYDPTKMFHFKLQQTFKIVIAAMEESIRVFVERNIKMKDAEYWSDTHSIFKHINSDIKNSKEFTRYLVDNGYIELINHNSDDVDWDAFHKNLMERVKDKWEPCKLPRASKPIRRSK